jgi:hypothetical protein
MVIKHTKYIQIDTSTVVKSFQALPLLTVVKKSKDDTCLNRSFRLIFPRLYLPLFI